MSLVALSLLAQLAAARGSVAPVLTRPEKGVDDSVAYQGYTTRVFRDAAGNSFQVYLDRREGRVVHVLANGDNESVGFSVRDSRGPIGLDWASPGARVSSQGRSRTLSYRLSADAPEFSIGHFLLGSMRVERDFQAFGEHRKALDATPFIVPELARLVAALGRLAPSEQVRHLRLLNTPDVQTLRQRLRPRIDIVRVGTEWVARVVQPAVDGADSLRLEIRASVRDVAIRSAPDHVVLSARARGRPVRFDVAVTTSAIPLTPLTRIQIFTPAFLAFVDSARTTRGDAASVTRSRWLERQVEGVAVLSSREKLMAGLPTYGTYFGRDMLVTALMMRPIWRPQMSEFVIASVLRKLSSSAEVSHEEALGGQAVREAAAEYAALIDSAVGALSRGATAGDSLLDRARRVLSQLRNTRENYHMIDDELQFPILVARWIQDAEVSRVRKRTFLLDAAETGRPRVERMLREFALVTRMSAPYAAAPVAGNLVSFAARGNGWASASWRDSNAGYAGGRYAMDVNAIWIPHALHSIALVLREMGSLGIRVDSVIGATPGLATSELAAYAKDTALFRRAVSTWSRAAHHFVVRKNPGQLSDDIAARLAALPAEERLHWTRQIETSAASAESIEFLAIALDAAGNPIGVMNTDAATRLFLGEPGDARDAPTDSVRRSVLRDVRQFTRSYPIGLFVEGVGPVVANDAYAPSDVWRAFERDPYHGPRVAWGREVNLFLLGIARRIADARGQSTEPSVRAYIEELWQAGQRVRRAAEASGFRSELWSFDFVGGTPKAVRYGSGADVQLWSTTDLVVQFVLSRARREETR